MAVLARAPADSRGAMPGEAKGVATVWGQGDGYSVGDWAVPLAGSQPLSWLPWLGLQQGQMHRLRLAASAQAWVIRRAAAPHTTVHAVSHHPSYPAPYTKPLTGQRHCLWALALGPQGASRRQWWSQHLLSLTSLYHAKCSGKARVVEGSNSGCRTSASQMAGGQEQRWQVPHL